MPRVFQVTAGQSQKERFCSACGRPIEPKQEVYKWTRRNNPTAWRHKTCGPPRASELSGRKTALVADAVRDATDALTSDVGPSDSEEIINIVENVALMADEVAQEYDDAVENMPENLRGSSTGQGMTDLAQELRDYADDIRNFDPEEHDDLQTAIDEAVAIIGDVPEYSG